MYILYVFKSSVSHHTSSTTSIPYIAKGKGGETAMELLKDTPGLELVLLTMPFFYSNFLAFFVPLPNEGRTQWELSASFGDGATKIDMMNVSDLGQLVRKYMIYVACFVVYT